MAEHGNRPIFSTEFGKIVHILANFGKNILSDTEILSFG